MGFNSAFKELIKSFLHYVPYSNALITQQPDDASQDGRHFGRLLPEAAQIKLETAGK
jgi:hypothetical protein